MEGFTREEIGAVLTVVKAFIDRKRFEGNYDYFITSAQESESKFIFSILDIAFDEVARGNDLVSILEKS